MSAKFQQFIAIAAVVAVVLVIGFFTIKLNTQQSTATGCTVTNTDTAMVGTSDNRKTQKRVYTEGCNGSSDVQVFTADDNLLYFQFNSADIYGSVKEGHTYDFNLRGYRQPLTTTFPNITSVTEVK